jgi:hypothetical protein
MNDDQEFTVKVREIKNLASRLWAPNTESESRKRAMQFCEDKLREQTGPPEPELELGDTVRIIRNGQEATVIEIRTRLDHPNGYVTRIGNAKQEFYYRNALKFLRKKSEQKPFVVGDPVRVKCYGDGVRGLLFIWEGWAVVTGLNTDSFEASPIVVTIDQLLHADS